VNPEEEDIDEALPIPPKELELEKASLSEPLEPEIEIQASKGTPSSSLFIEEDRMIGSVSPKIFLRCIYAMGGFPAHLLMIFFGFCSSILENLVIYKFLGYAKQLSDSTRANGASQIILLSLLYAFTGVGRGIVVMISNLFAARKIHSRMVFSFIHCKISEFLERVPEGRIINRFSEDIETLDTRIGFSFSSTYLFFSYIVVNMVVIIYSERSLYFLIPCLILVIIGAWLRTLYMGLKREVIRLKRTTKSPITSCLGEALNGMVELRTQGKQAYQMTQLDHLINENNKNNLMIYGLDSWFSNMVLNTTMLVVQIPAYSYVVWTIYSATESIDLRLTMMFLLSATQIAPSLLYLLQRFCELETNLISIERCLSFEEIMPEEGYKDLDRQRKAYQFPKKSTIKKILSEESKSRLFTNGSITLENVSASYPNTDRDVLQNLSISFKSGEKIGVVGRTGAGKTSLIKLFWRGLKVREGKIVVDGFDISSLDLKDLRREIMIVSQETAMFSGTLRENIDPKLEYLMPHDSEQFKEGESKLINKLIDLGFDQQRLNEHGLNFKIEGNGDNLSLGERQIISFARTLVADNRIIILDEATASVDMKTEQLIQNIITKEFATKTMIVIAHRIQTILKCDRILVLENGRVAEFDTIQNLLMKEDGWFKKIYNKFNSHV